MDPECIRIQVGLCIWIPDPGRQTFLQKIVKKFIFGVLNVLLGDLEAFLVAGKPFM